MLHKREKEMMSDKAELQPGKEAGASDSLSTTTTRKFQTLTAPARACLAVLPIILLLSSSAFAEAAASGAEKNVIGLKERVILPGPDIMLGDVAEIAGPAAGKLAETNLGPVPWPGTERLIDATVVKIKLYRDRFDLTMAEITGKGCVVSTKTVTVSGEEILNVARNLLIGRLPWAPENTSIEPEAPPLDHEVAAGSAQIVLEATMAGSIATGGKTRVVVTGKAADQPLFRTTVSFQVRIFETIIVARRAMHRGEVFSEDNVVGRRLDVTTLSPSDLYSQASGLIGNKAARSIRTGVPITQKMVIIPPIINRGDKVEMVFKTKFFILAAWGIAEEPGAPHQVIRVTNIDSGREVIGRVLPTGKVSVAF
jgi:flagella basal body P-ring formation protein FlgA